MCACAVCAAARDISASRRRIATEALRSDDDDEVGADEEDNDAADAEDDNADGADKKEGEEAGGGDDRAESADPDDRRGIEAE